jgi:hypothetical protein
MASIVIFTKDNLAERNWYGSKKCVFYHQDETIKHLFFQCKFARFIWSAIQIWSTLYQPRSIKKFVKFKRLIRMEAIAIIWSLWLCRNDKIFNNISSSFLQVIYRCTAMLRSWVPLQRVEHRDLFTDVSSRLKDTARDIFSQHG